MRVEELLARLDDNIGNICAVLQIDRRALVDSLGRVYAGNPHKLFEDIFAVQDYVYTRDNEVSNDARTLPLVLGVIVGEALAAMRAPSGVAHFKKFYAKYFERSDKLYFLMNITISKEYALFSDPKEPYHLCRAKADSHYRDLTGLVQQAHCSTGGSGTRMTTCNCLYWAAENDISEYDDKVAGILYSLRSAFGHRMQGSAMLYIDSIQRPSDVSPNFYGMTIVSSLPASRSSKRQSLNLGLERARVQEIIDGAIGRYLLDPNKF